MGEDKQAQGEHKLQRGSGFPAGPRPEALAPKAICFGDGAEGITGARGQPELRGQPLKVRIQLAARGTQGLQAHPDPPKPPRPFPSHLPARLLKTPLPKGPPRCQPGTGSTDFPPGSPHGSVPTAPCHFPIPGAEGEVPEVPAGSTRTWLTPGAGSTARVTPTLLTLWRGRNPQNPIPQPRDCRQRAASRGDPPAFTPDTIFPPGITVSPPQMPPVSVPSTTTPPVGDRGGQGGTGDSCGAQQVLPGSLPAAPAGSRAAGLFRGTKAGSVHTQQPGQMLGTGAAIQGKSRRSRDPALTSPRPRRCAGQPWGQDIRAEHPPKAQQGMVPLKLGSPAPPALLRRAPRAQPAPSATCEWL